MRYLITSLIAIFCVSWTTQALSSQGSESQVPESSKANSSSPSVKKKIVTTQTCTQHSDCVLVNTDCCPCSSGGNMKAVHQSLVESHNQKIKQQCSSTSSDLACPEVYLCGKWKAECINSSCKAVEKTPPS